MKVRKKKINKRQFINPKSGNSIISEYIPFDIICNDEGIHMLEDYCIVHIVFWKNLTSKQEGDFINFVKKNYPKQLLESEILGEGEYKFKLKYAELV